MQQGWAITLPYTEYFIILTGIFQCSEPKIGVQGEMMDGQGGLPDSHHFRHVLTNVTLGILQDSNWYACPQSSTLLDLLKVLDFLL